MDTLHAVSPLSIQIKPLREAKGWTQAELAEQAGVSRITVNRIEQGNHKTIDLEVLDRIAKALGVAPGLLIVER